MCRRWRASGRRRPQARRSGTASTAQHLPVPRRWPASHDSAMDQLFDWARHQGGVFTTRQAARHGLDADALTMAVDRALVRRLAQGVYAVGEAPKRAEERHLELCRGLLARHPDAVLAGRSAVVALGLPVWDVPLATALMQRPVQRQVRRTGAEIRPLDPDAVTLYTETGRVQQTVRAVAQLAIDHGAARGVVAADAALRRGLMTVADVAEELVRRAGHPRVQQLAALHRMCDATAESPGESRLRVLLTGWGFVLEPQFVIRDGDRVVARVDFRVAGTRVLIEFDGLVKYRDGGADALAREKRREDRLRALGWVVIRVTWRDLENPAKVLALVRQAVAQDAVRRPSAAS